MSVEREEIGGVVEAALEISERRRQTLARLRQALEEGRDDDAVGIARRYCGLDDDEHETVN